MLTKILSLQGKKFKNRIRMTIEIEIIEPRAQKLLEELVNLNLIKFVQSKRKKAKSKVVVEALPTRAEIKAGLMESAKEVRAAIRGEIKLRSIYDVLDEMEAEQKNQKMML
jgi:hypothetical protein